MSYYSKYLKYKSKYLQLLEELRRKKLKKSTDLESTNEVDKENMEPTPQLTRSTPRPSPEELQEIRVYTEFDRHIERFFKTYNLISWNRGKLYSVPEKNIHLRQFCKELNHATKGTVTNCTAADSSGTARATEASVHRENSESEPAVEAAAGEAAGEVTGQEDFIPTMCCVLNGTRVVSKRTLRNFDVGTRIKKDDINLQFIDFFPRILAQDVKKIARRNLVKYQREIIIRELPNLDKTKLKKIDETFDDYDDDYDIENLTNEQRIQIINDDEFLNLEQVVKTIFTDRQLEEDDNYAALLASIETNRSGQQHSIQEHENKLFLQIENDPIPLPLSVSTMGLQTRPALQTRPVLSSSVLGSRPGLVSSSELSRSGLSRSSSDPVQNKSYYFYFSFGTLNFIEYVNWEESLDPYVEKIRELLSDPTVKSIVLGGHSVGSIVIQHLAIELIKNGIDTSKIFVIGSGCRKTQVLNDEELEIFRRVFDKKYFFVLSAFVGSDRMIHYDHRSNDRSNQINPINTNILVCEGYKIDRSYECEATMLEILDIPAVNASDSFIPDSDVILHDFKTYSDFYLD